MQRSASGQAALNASPGLRGELEEQGYICGFRHVAGVDEVGRGPLAGPVVAAAVVFPRGKSHPQIQDSKLISAKKRQELAGWIKGEALTWGLGVVDVEVIDRINILKASLLAMARALKQLRPFPDYLLIDGPHQIPLEFFELDGEESAPREGEKLFSPRQAAIPHGDRLCHSIAAASIIAKVARDQMMQDYDKLYPAYGFAQHKGYGSPNHLAALNRYGPSPIHRRGFRPVRESRGSR